MGDENFELIFGVKFRSKSGIREDNLSIEDGQARVVVLCRLYYHIPLFMTPIYYFFQLKKKSTFPFCDVSHLLNFMGAGPTTWIDQTRKSTVRVAISRMDDKTRGKAGLAPKFPSIRTVFWAARNRAQSPMASLPLSSKTNILSSFHQMTLPSPIPHVFKFQINSLQ